MEMTPFAPEIFFLWGGGGKLVSPDTKIHAYTGLKFLCIMQLELHTLECKKLAVNLKKLIPADIRIPYTSTLRAL